MSVTLADAAARILDVFTGLDLDVGAGEFERRYASRMALEASRAALTTANRADNFASHGGIGRGGGGGGSKPTSGAAVIGRAGGGLMVGFAEGLRVSARVSARDRIDAKRRLATDPGAQAALVKIISFAAGGTRCRELMNYVSREGREPLEMDRGDVIEERALQEELIDHWLDDHADSRQPTRDVMSFAFSVDRDRFADPGQRAARINGHLKSALPGHRYAFSVERAKDDVRISVTMTLQSTAPRREGKGRVRLSGTDKSREAIARGLEEHFQQPIILTPRGVAHGIAGARKHLMAMSRHGDRTIHLDDGGSISSYDAITDHAQSWRRAMKSRGPRDVMHLLVSSKPGTPPGPFLEAARAFLSETFRNHDYAFVLHHEADGKGKRAHPHVHAMVVMGGRDGKRLNPRIQDLAEWRERMARERGIAMFALERSETGRGRARQIEIGAPHAGKARPLHMASAFKAHSMRQHVKAYRAIEEWGAARTRIAGDGSLSASDQRQASDIAHAHQERLREGIAHWTPQMVRDESLEAVVKAFEHGARGGGSREERTQRALKAAREAIDEQSLLFVTAEDRVAAEPAMRTAYEELAAGGIGKTRAEITHEIDMARRRAEGRRPDRDRATEKPVAPSMREGDRERGSKGRDRKDRDDREER